MSLMLDARPEDEPAPRAPLPRRAWPWLTGVVGAVAGWFLVLAGSPSWGPWSVAALWTVGVLAIPMILALVGVGILVRTSLPGWAIAAAHFAVLPMALLLPLGVAAISNRTDGSELLFAAGFSFFYGCIWALTALLVCSALTLGRVLLRAVRERPETPPASTLW